MVTCLKDTCPETGANTCCAECAEYSDCQMACTIDPNGCPHRNVQEETALTAFVQQHMAVFKEIKSLVTAKNEIERKEKELKDQLKQAMEAHGIKAIDNEILKITYIAATTSTGIDSTKLKRKYPIVAAECSKETPKSAYIKIEVKKDGENNA